MGKMTFRRVIDHRCGTATSHVHLDLCSRLLERRPSEVASSIEPTISRGDCVSETDEIWRPHASCVTSMSRVLNGVIFFPFETLEAVWALSRILYVVSVD